MNRLAIGAAAFATLAAVSTTSFAAEPVDRQPLLLSTAQLDLIDAGMRRRHGFDNRARAFAGALALGRQSRTTSFSWAGTVPGKSVSISYSSASTGGGKGGKNGGPR